MLFLYKNEVKGSNPFLPNYIREIAQVDRARVANKRFL